MFQERFSGFQRPEFAFWSSPLAPTAPVHTISVGRQLALFHERIQGLSELNETAAIIWRCLSDGFTCEDIAKRLHRLGATHADADSFVTLAVTDWLRAGFVVPCEAIAALTGQPTETQCICIGSCLLGLCCYGEVDAKAVAAVFGQFASEDADPHRQISIVSYSGCNFLFLGKAAIGMRTPRQTVPALKALITEEYCRAVPHGFVAHGGIVSANGRSIFLAGEPGAGKSTLALALTTRNFAYAGDDVVHVGADGAAFGVPFAAAAKSTAWDLLLPYLPQLDSLPVYERADQQLTRYVLPERLDLDGPRPINIALLLDRQVGAETRLEPIAPLQMLCILLESGYSERGAMDATTLGCLAQTLSHAKSFRLIYDGLPDAIRTIESLIRE